jgi:hypothetical protein
MEDLFQVEHPKTSLKRTNNGIASAAKAAYKSEVKRTERDAEFKTILEDIGGMPLKNQIASIKTNGLSDTGSIFRNLVNNHKMNELFLATWIISPENINSICDAIDSGQLQSVVMVCSTRMDELKKAHANKLKEEFLKRNTKISFKICNSHAKVFSISDFKGNNYTICGSGNWTENPRIEYYLILNNDDVFNHNKEWMTKLIE